MFPYEVILHGIAGSIAAVLSTSLLFPIDQIKIHLQLSEKCNKGNENEEEDEGEITVRSTIKKIHKASGIKGFYRGIIPVIFGNIVSQFVYFFWYNLLKIVSNTHHTSMIEYAKCSMIAGVIASICTNPFWVLQTRMLKTNGGVIRIAVQMYQKEGITSFFKGLTTSIILVANPIINYMIYESYKEWAQSQMFDSEYDAFIYFFGGAIGKFFATVATYPYQLIRTKSHISKEKGYAKMIVNIYQQGGIPAFFRGLLPKMSQTVLSSAFCIMFYEEIFQFLESFALLVLANNIYIEIIKCTVFAAFLAMYIYNKTHERIKPNQLQHSNSVQSD